MAWSQDASAEAGDATKEHSPVTQKTNPKKTLLKIR
jgi:hypothetical protein